MYNYSDELISDFHKDAYGYRPGVDYMAMWDSFTPAEKQVEWDYLEKVMTESIERDRVAAEEAVEDFEAEVQYTIKLGARDRETALRWMVQTETFYHEQDVEFWVWDHGILFTDAGRALVKELMDIVDFKEWESV